MKSESADFSGVTIAEIDPKDTGLVKRIRLELGELVYTQHGWSNFIFLKGNEIVALAKVSVDGKEADINKFRVKSKFRSKGVGKLSIELLDKELAKRGVKRSQVYSVTAAIPFWRRTKYKETRVGSFRRNPQKNKQRNPAMANQNILNPDRTLARRKRTGKR
jgi:predicted acetyltransferase